jgi:isopentenyl-diphosphate Delta-isomerase
MWCISPYLTQLPARLSSQAVLTQGSLCQNVLSISTAAATVLYPVEALPTNHQQGELEMSEQLHTTRSGELLDVVDLYGKTTGEVLDKKTIHELGLRHRDVHVWVTNGRDVLQQQRALDKSIMPGAWDVSVGGHVGAGESFLDAAVRETQEELGILAYREDLVRIGRVATQLHFPGWEKPHNIVGDNFVYFDPELDLERLKLQEEEVVGARWYPIDQLEDDLANPATAELHAPQPMVLYALGIAGMRGVAASM